MDLTSQMLLHAECHTSTLHFISHIAMLTFSLQLTVLITDENDNSPVFQQSSYSTAVSEALAVGSGILNVLATDTDYGSNAAVVYSIVHQQPNLTGTSYTIIDNFQWIGEISKGIVTMSVFFAEPVFSIDNVTGVISLFSPLDRESNDLFTLTILARDQGVPTSLSASVSHTHTHTPLPPSLPASLPPPLPPSQGVGDS